MCINISFIKSHRLQNYRLYNIIIDYIKIKEGIKEENINKKILYS